MTNLPGEGLGGSFDRVLLSLEDIMQLTTSQEQRGEYEAMVLRGGSLPTRTNPEFEKELHLLRFTMQLKLLSQFDQGIEPSPQEFQADLLPLIPPELTDVSDSKSIRKKFFDSLIDGMSQKEVIHDGFVEHQKLRQFATEHNVSPATVYDDEETYKEFVRYQYGTPEDHARYMLVESEIVRSLTKAVIGNAIQAAGSDHVPRIVVGAISKLVERKTKQTPRDASLRILKKIERYWGLDAIKTLPQELKKKLS